MPKLSARFVVSRSRRPCFASASVSKTSWRIFPGGSGTAISGAGTCSPKTIVWLGSSTGREPRRGACRFSISFISSSAPCASSLELRLARSCSAGCFPQQEPEATVSTVSTAGESASRSTREHPNRWSLRIGFRRWRTSSSTPIGIRTRRRIPTGGDQTWRQFCKRSCQPSTGRQAALLVARAHVGVAGAAHPLEATILTDLTALDAVEDDWRRLAERRGNPFLTPEWFRAWIAYRDDVRPYAIATHRADGSLLGVMPFVLSKSGLFPTLSFAGAEFGDLFHPVAETSDEVAVAAATARTLGDHRADWSVIVADYVDDRAPWVSELFIGESMRLATMHYHDQPSLYLIAELTGRTWDEYLSTRSPNFRSQIGRKLRRLQREHDVAFHQVDSLDELEPRMKVLFNLHERRWRDRGSSVFATDESRAFHLAFARAALNRGWLRLWSLDVDGETVAAWYGWRLGRPLSVLPGRFQPGLESLQPRIAPSGSHHTSCNRGGCLRLRHAPRGRAFQVSVRFGCSVCADGGHDSAVTSSQGCCVGRDRHPAARPPAPPRVHVKVKQFAEPVMQRWSVGAAP